MTAFIKAARVIGDLDDDFYRDERQRDVWNEASAVGFQLTQWIALAAAAVLPWAAGRVGAWVSLGIIVAWMVVSIATTGYARSQDVDVYASAKKWRPRAILAAALYIVGVLGIYARLSTPLDQDPATWFGAVVGGICGASAVFALIAWRKRRDARRLAEEEARDAEDL
ncbi:DUF2029 domain-containing protein [Rhodococcus phenolicus]|uniref:DUF2029 domain-containing protein n=1 Tax=Rhodococcus phenolicus TaxID=263849 RepID=UPI00082A3B3F|nr:DUF2029 domain-containing protein [Rhodococcus phenolicus]